MPRSPPHPLCRLGWNGVGDGAQSQDTLSRCANPCVVSRFFAAVDSAVARCEEGATAGRAPQAPKGDKLPRMQTPVGGYYHNLAISASGKLFAWGCGNFGGENDGQQGFGDLSERTDPAPVSAEPLRFSGELAARCHGT
jgi:hypothetical protein